MSPSLNRLDAIALCLTEEQVDLLVQIAENFLPDDAEIPNEETLEALKEAEEIASHPDRYPSFNSFEDLMREVLDDA
ncbi:MAG: hypothetical protein IJU56_00190 [Clostridia bacterium]|nr:hypothetical protein [Clostridia bacterium]